MGEIKCPNCKTGVLREPVAEERFIVVEAMIDHDCFTDHSSADKVTILLCDCGFCEWVSVGHSWAPYWRIAEALAHLKKDVSLA